MLIAARAPMARSKWEDRNPGPLTFIVDSPQVMYQRGVVPPKPHNMFRKVFTFSLSALLSPLSLFLRSASVRAVCCSLQEVDPLPLLGLLSRLVAVRMIPTVTFLRLVAMHAPSNVNDINPVWYILLWHFPCSGRDLPLSPLCSEYPVSIEHLVLWDAFLNSVLSQIYYIFMEIWL